MCRYFSLFLSFIFFSNLTLGGSTNKNYDYASVLNKAIYRLNCNPGDKSAIKKIQKTYSEAMGYYRNEIELLQRNNDSLKWTKTLDLMQKTNDLSEEILYNSAANAIIWNPDFYTVEIDSVTPKAVAEVYNLGAKSLAFNTKRKAKEAYSYFTDAGKLNPKYKDVGQKIQEARSKATVSVIFEKVTAYSENKNLFTEKFYQTVFYNLWSGFLNDPFFNIYSESDAANRKSSNADWKVSISFINFEITNISTFENTQSVYTSGVAEVKIFSTVENRYILNTRLSAQYIWKNYRPGNQLDLQDLFDSFSLSVSDQFVELLTDKFTQLYNEAKIVP